MCLARYSPRATTTDQPTNRAPNEPARPICAQESIFSAKFGKKPLFYGRKQKFWYPHIRKTTPCSHFFGQARNQMDQKNHYFAQNDQKCIFWAKFGYFWAKNPNFNERKQKLWYPQKGKTTRYLVFCYGIPNFVNRSFFYFSFPSYGRFCKKKKMADAPKILLTA